MRSIKIPIGHWNGYVAELEVAEGIIVLLSMALFGLLVVLVGLR